MAETERLLYSSEIFIINATALSVDVYVNYASEPALSDPKPLVLSPVQDDYNAPVFVAKGEKATPYGMYTFAVRPKGSPGAEVLAAASIELVQGRSYTGVFHELDPAQYGFSIYENDLSPGELARLTVIHAARAQDVTWEIRPNGEDPEAPPDVRFGALQRGEWQTARNVVDNDYTLEFFTDGALVARNPDLDLARAKLFVAIVFGDLQPSQDEQVLLWPIVTQELEFEDGPPEPSEVTPPAPPLAVRDRNARVEFVCEPLETWQTNTARTIVTATDPDGRVVDLAIEAVAPPVGGIAIADKSFVPSPAIGAQATVELAFDSDIPHGRYTVRIGANRGSFAEQAGCLLALTVLPITIARLHAVVDDYRLSGDLEPELADAVHALLDGAARHQNEGDLEQACDYLKDVLGLIGSQKGKAASDRAHDHVERETKALQSDLRCG